MAVKWNKTYLIIIIPESGSRCHHCSGIQNPDQNHIPYLILTASKRQVKTTYKFSNSERQQGLTDGYDRRHCVPLRLDLKPHGAVEV